MFIYLFVSLLIEPCLLMIKFNELIMQPIKKKKAMFHRSPPVSAPHSSFLTNLLSNANRIYADREIMLYWKPGSSWMAWE